MLILSRKVGEEIVINDNIFLKIVAVKADNVRLGVVAPPDVKVFRFEIYEEIQKQNKAALGSSLEELNHFEEKKLRVSLKTDLEKEKLKTEKKVLTTSKANKNSPEKNSFLGGSWNLIHKDFLDQKAPQKQEPQNDLTLSLEQADQKKLRQASDSFFLKNSPVLPKKE